MEKLLAKAKKKLVPGYQSDAEILGFVRELSPELRAEVQKAVKIVQQLEYLKWGIVTPEELEVRISNITKDKT